MNGKRARNVQRLHISTTLMSIVLVAGCGAAESDAARSEATRIFGCTSSSVHVTRVSKSGEDTSTYDASGCGQSATLVCVTKREPVGAMGRGYNTDDLVTRCRRTP
jgi:hypothetical protein